MSAAQLNFRKQFRCKMLLFQKTADNNVSYKGIETGYTLNVKIPFFLKNPKKGTFYGTVFSQYVQINLILT